MPKNIYYWTEPIAFEGHSWILFTAVFEEGLLMSDLGTSPQAAEKYLGELRKLAERYLPAYSLIPDREENLPVIRQIKEYLDGQRRNFDLRLHPLGTAFQQKVWQELLRIPYGETNCYGDIALRVGCPKGQRAVGMANNRNPLGVVVPCHRVIGKKGALTGYAGGLEIKELLLKLEKRGKQG